MARTDPLATISTRTTDQRQPSRPDQVQNSAGGYVFDVGADARVMRFLTLGTAGGTFYVGEAQSTADNAAVILDAARTRGSWLVEQIVAVSLAGRAMRQQPGLFALAAVAGLGDDAARSAALTALPQVCRTGTTLFQFATYVEQFRGWGRGLRRAVAAWYHADNFDVDSLAYQLIKYRQREGWTHRDLLRLAHPVPAADDTQRRALFGWATGRLGLDAHQGLPDFVRGYMLAQQVADDQRTAGVAYANLVHNYRLPWEALPDTALAHPEVWRELVMAGMPITALIRQLPRLTRLGLFDDREVLAAVAQHLGDREQLRRGRVHPIALLLAQRTYAGGRSLAAQSGRESASWSPNSRIVDALDAAFYASFETVEPAGKRTLVALDVSGSMDSPAGGTPLSCREASVAMALVILATEPDSEVVGFTSGTSRSAIFHGSTVIQSLDISTRRRLDDNVRAVSDLPFGGTDCALPMTWAREAGRDFDTFVVITDNETWAGGVHPHQALERYRRQRVADARLAVLAMTPSRFSIADPNDPGQLDVSGFDAAVPTLLRNFAAGLV
jgi:60 kDa SS-A/Ro ribonucleoprotein